MFKWSVAISHFLSDDSMGELSVFISSDKLNSFWTESEELPPSDSRREQLQLLTHCNMTCIFIVMI